MGADDTLSSREQQQRDLNSPSAFTDIQAQSLLTWIQAVNFNPATNGNTLPVASRILSSPTTRLHAQQFSHGQSNPTYKLTLFSYETGSIHFTFVLRAQPPGQLLPGAHRLDREFKVLHALHMYTSVPVPIVYAFCANGSSILPRQQFYIMQYVNGYIFNDLNFPSLSVKDRSQVYSEAGKVLRLLANIDVNVSGLGSLSRPSPSWVKKQVDAWQMQLRRTTDNFPDIDYPQLSELHTRLSRHPVYLDNKQKNMTLVHGDFRIDNLVFQRWSDSSDNINGKLVCVAVLDWELVSLGTPLADFTQLLVPFSLPPQATRIPVLQSIVMPSPIPNGVPSVAQLVNDFVTRAGMNKVEVEKVKNLVPVYVAVSLFRLSAVLCGVLARARQGNASSSLAELLGKQVHFFAQAGITALDSQATESDTEKYVEKRNGADDSLGDRLKKFMREEVMPLEDDYFKHVFSERRWEPWMPLERLKEKAKAAGLWNLFLSKGLGGVLSSEEYAPLATIMGRCVYASEAFNCSPPDTGNMELLIRYGTEEQKERWLKPLLNGEIRSCFGMTEPDVASSDATNLKTLVEYDESNLSYVINGRKWWTSGAMDKRCKVMLLIARGPSISSDAPRHRHHSVLLVPMETTGVSIVRSLTVFGFDDAPHGHAEVVLNNVRLPRHEALLHVEGGGFEAAQSRLGGGRLHHCMRLVGSAERALELMIRRAGDRKAFGKQSMLENDAVVQRIGECRCEIESMRSLVTATARAVDEVDGGGKKEKERARVMVGAVKVMVPKAGIKVVDEAIQMHGGMGVCQDSLLGIMYAHARSLRIADGPDEVHLLNVAKHDIRRSAKL